MTQININSEIVQKLEQLSQQTEKSVDELLELLLNRYSDILINDNTVADDDVTWSNEEIEAFLTTKTPLSSQEIVEQGLLGTWADKNISDGQEWVEEQRAKRRKSFQW